MVPLMQLPDLQIPGLQVQSHRSWRVRVSAADDGKVTLSRAGQYHLDQSAELMQVPYSCASTPESAAAEVDGQRRNYRTLGRYRRVDRVKFFRSR